MWKVLIAVPDGNTIAIIGTPIPATPATPLHGEGDRAQH